MFRVPLPPRPTAKAYPPPTRGHRAPVHRPPPFVVSRFGGLRSFYIRHFSSLDSVMYRTSRILINTVDCVSLQHVTDGRVHMPSAQGRAELRAGAGVVAIGVGSPVARPGADGRRMREARAAVGAVCAVDAVCVLGAAVVTEGVGGVETRPLARPPKGTQKKSLDAAVA